MHCTLVFYFINATYLLQAKSVVKDDLSLDEKELSGGKISNLLLFSFFLNELF